MDVCRENASARTASRSQRDPFACSPVSGWEKGPVETRIGLKRERFFAPKPSVRKYAELNAWLLDQVIGYAKAHRHPERRDLTIRETFEVERPSLVPYAGRFDGLQALPAAVSKKGLTPDAFICKRWTIEPENFKLDPIHHMPELNIEEPLFLPSPIVGLGCSQPADGETGWRDTIGDGSIMLGQRQASGRSFRKSRSPMPSAPATASVEAGDPSISPAIQRRLCAIVARISCAGRCRG